MRKQIDVEIVRSSWATQPDGQSHPFPSELANCPNTTRVDFLRAMLWIGVLSVPVRVPRWWMAIRWALVRYLGMVDDSASRLCLHPAIVDLDAHQKTVLSDDWGMGLTLEWLDTRFQYSVVENGMSYLKRLERQGLAYFNGPAKRRGPKKCPDFVGVDRQRKLHLIECKGNQQGLKNLVGQLSDGRSQKQNVLFADEASIVGQRLVAGVAIATSGGRWNSVLRVEDPLPDPEREHYLVRETNSEILLNELKIGLLARMLTLAGEISLLQRLLPDELEEQGLDDFAFETRQRFESPTGEWVGRVDRARLPLPIRIGDRLVRWFSIRHGVNPKLLSMLSSQTITERPHLAEYVTTRLERDDSSRERSIQPPPGDGDLYAAIQWGDSFISDFALH